MSGATRRQRPPLLMNYDDFGFPFTEWEGLTIRTTDDKRMEIKVKKGKGFERLYVKHFDDADGSGVDIVSHHTGEHIFLEY